MYRYESDYNVGTCVDYTYIVTARTHMTIKCMYICLLYIHSNFMLMFDNTVMQEIYARILIVRIVHAQTPYTLHRYFKRTLPTAEPTGLTEQATRAANQTVAKEVLTLTIL